MPSQAIGLVINMALDPAEARTKDPHMRSFTVTPIDAVGKALVAAGVPFEFAEYLKGETHYIVVTIKKTALLRAGALKQDLGGSTNLLTASNLDEPALLRLSRTIATTLGLPESTAFCGFHAAKLFDFSSRARCLSAFRTLGVRGGGAVAGAVVAADLEAHPYLRAEEGKWFERNLGASVAAVAKLEQAPPPTLPLAICPNAPMPQCHNAPMPQCPTAPLPQ